MNKSSPSMTKGFKREYGGKVSRRILQAGDRRTKRRHASEFFALAVK
jgi:hypothetical protein